jgi:hypothetical protein
MAKKKAAAEVLPVVRKFVRVFEDENSKSTWTYDLSKHTAGPISTEYIDKNEPEVIPKKKKKATTKKLK